VADSDTEVVHLSLEGPLAVVTLDHAPLNIFNLAMRDGLIEALRAVNDIDDVKAMVLRSEGRHFSAGADLSEFGSAESIFEARRIRWDRDPWSLLWDLRVPTVAALHGIAVGSGLEMALLCDLRIAAPDTMVGLPETKLGMLPAAGGTQSLTRAVGPHQSLPVVALGTTMTAAEALARGLVSDVVDDVEAGARAWTEQLAQLDADTLRAARRLLRAAQDLPLSQGLVAEQHLARLLRSR
jgi:enoyl-CoA hydratase/carnithine racemase